MRRRSSMDPTMMKGRWSTVTMMRRSTVTGPSKVPTMMKGRWSTVTGPSVVMNGTVVGGSLSTNLPHTNF